jgi:HSP20 family protein
MNLVKRNRQQTMLDPWRNLFDVESFFPNWPASSRNSLPAVNVSEDDKTYTIDVVAPGFKKEDFKINVNDDVLTISAESKTESPNDDNNNKQYSRREYSYSSFTRSFSLPDNAKDDAISANYSDGILRLNIPKTETQTKASKEIRID